MGSQILTSGGGSSVGQIGHFAVVPDGWLKANGTTVSREDYADLFASIGTMFGVGDGLNTFKLPDLRGRFLRVVDDGKGLDSGRVVGSSQSDNMGSHRHVVTAYLNDSFVGSGNGIQRTPTKKSSSGSTSYTQYAGSSETRPQNIALYACIKY